MNSPTIVMLAGKGNSTTMVYNGLTKAGLTIEHVLIEDKIPHRQLLHRRVKKLGRTTVLGQILFQGALVPLLEREAQQRIKTIVQTMNLDQTPIELNRTTAVPSVNAPQTLALLQALNPAIIVVNGTRIIARRVLHGVAAQFVNTHAGITPLYRGVHGGYWALVQDRKDACGVTVHRVDAGIDNGSILAQALINPLAADSFVTYPLLQLAVGLPLLVESISALTEGFIPQQTPPPGPSRLWSHPTIWGYLWRRAHYGIR